MQNKYGKINLATGAHIAGICSLKIIPKEWLKENYKPDFKTGFVTKILLQTNREFIAVNMVPETIKFLEKPKSNKSGIFFETLITGTTNKLDFKTLQFIETYRYHEWVAIIKDKQGREKVIGNMNAAMIFDYTHSEDNTAGGNQRIDITMAMQQENAAHFFGSIPYESIPTLPPDFIQVPIPRNFTTVKDIQDHFLITWEKPIYPAGTTYLLQYSYTPNFSTRIYNRTLSTIETSNCSLDFFSNIRKKFFFRIKAIFRPLQDSWWAYSSCDNNLSGNTFPKDNLWLDLNSNQAIIKTDGTGSLLSWADSSVPTKGNLSINSTTGLSVYGPGNAINQPVVTNRSNTLGSLSLNTQGFPDNAHGMTIYIVGAQRVTDDYNGAFIRVGKNILLCRNQSTNQLIVRMRYGYGVYYTADIADDVYYTFRLQFTGSMQSLCVNNNYKVSNSATDIPWTPAILDLLKSSTGTSNKDLARVLIFTESHSDEKVQMVEEYLRTYYGHY